MAQFIHQLTISGPETSLVSVLPIGATTIGRQPDNDLVLVHPLVSRYHARIDCTAEACQITDLASTHGTMVNRATLAAQAPHALNPGDVIEIGAFRLQYQAVDASEPMLAPGPESTLEAVPEAAMARPAQPEPNGDFGPPPGLSLTKSRYLQYLPDIYQSDSNDFISRFLAMLESILIPIEWNIDNFDLYLDPRSAPAAFLPWLANWYELTFDESWTEESQRALLAEAHQIYRRRGTLWALSRVLEIYTGVMPRIDDQNRNLDPFTFTVRIPLTERQVNQSMIEQIIDSSKPAHTSYTLTFEQ